MVERPVQMSFSSLTPRGRKNRFRCRTVRLQVSAADWRTAARIGREYSGRKLETVLAAFAGDLAVAAARPGSWEHERVTGWLASHVWECERKD
jgi:hypothetical protein